MQSSTGSKLVKTFKSKQHFDDGSSSGRRDNKKQDYNRQQRIKGQSKHQEH